MRYAVLEAVNVHRNYILQYNSINLVTRISKHYSALIIRVKYKP
jgi:hypothetical protein